MSQDSTLESIPLTPTHPTPSTTGQSARSRSPHVSFDDLATPSAGGSKPKRIWPYCHRLGDRMQYAPVTHHEDEADIADIGISRGNSHKALGSRLLSAFGYGPSISAPADTIIPLLTAQEPDGTDSDHGRQVHEHSHGHHASHCHGSHAQSNRSQSSTGRKTQSVLHTFRQVHRNLSAFVTPCLPPPEDPCAPSACCCWAAVHDLCFSPAVDNDSDDEHEHDHGTHAHHGELKVKKVLDPHDIAGCTEHCCDESRYFLSTRAKPPTSCHGH